MRSLAATISLKVSAILPMMPTSVAGQPHREITDPHGLEGMKQFGEAVGVAVEAEVCVALRQGGGGRRAVGVGRCDDFIGGLHSYLQTPSWGAHGQ